MNQMFSLIGQTSLTCLNLKPYNQLETLMLMGWQQCLSVTHSGNSFRLCLSVWEKQLCLCSHSLTHTHTQRSEADWGRWDMLHYSTTYEWIAWCFIVCSSDCLFSQTYGNMLLLCHLVEWKKDKWVAKCAGFFLRFQLFSSLWSILTLLLLLWKAVILPWCISWKRIY